MGEESKERYTQKNMNKSRNFWKDNSGTDGKDRNDYLRRN